MFLFSSFDLPLVDLKLLVQEGDNHDWYFPRQVTSVQSHLRAYVMRWLTEVCEGRDGVLTVYV